MDHSKREVGVHSVQRGGRVNEMLTARERDVLATLGRGFSNKHIARVLQISPETVKSHVKRIFLKLAVRTRTQVVLRAGTLGLFDIPEQCQKHKETHHTTDAMERASFRSTPLVLAYGEAPRPNTTDIPRSSPCSSPVRRCSPK
jgi:DNA-binding CsgD family transcriptional regulator